MHIDYTSYSYLHVAEDQVTTGSGIFSAFFMFQLHVYDSLYLQGLAFSQVPSGIALIEYHCDLLDCIWLLLSDKSQGHMIPIHIIHLFYSDMNIVSPVLIAISI